MTIILLSSDKLKICMDKHEIEIQGLSHSNLEYHDPKVKSALVALLQKAGIQAGFHPKGAKVIVEILPDGGDGCIIYFTAVHGLKLSPEGAGIEPVVFEFQSAFDLADALGELYTRYSHRIYKSSLFESNDKYILVVRCLDYTDKQSESFILEFAEKIGSGEVLAAYIGEHCCLIFEDNAIDIIGRELTV